MNTRNYVKTAFLTALIAVGAYIKIPMPLIPFTLQTFFVMLAGIVLGAKYGALSVALYILLGLAGLPVFTGGGGIMYVLHPTFGYMIGFTVAAFAIGKLSSKKNCLSFVYLFLCCMAGTLIVYAFGTAYFWLIKRFYFESTVSAYTLFVSCFLITLPADIIKSALASFIGIRLYKSKVIP